MDIHIDDLEGPEIAQLLCAHLENAADHSPPDSIHALDLNALKQTEITFWSIWDKGHLLGCGALKELTSTHGEIKSMHTSQNHRGRGIASKLLQHIISVAKKRGYENLSLETGTMAGFAPARAIYKKHGFGECPPFANYFIDPNSVCMTLAL